jgi:hypothetical protein
MPNLVSPRGHSDPSKNANYHGFQKRQERNENICGGPGAALVPLLREPGNSRQIYGGEQHLGAEFGGERLSFSAAFW